MKNTFEPKPMAATEGIGIYLHIPFCRRKCGYCDFYSFPRDPGDPIYAEFAAALQMEIALRSSHPLYRWPVKTIYIGGGTPSLVASHLLERFIETLNRYFDLHAVEEFTIEVNPGTLSLKKARFYPGIGINRISLGVQAFQESCLRALERIHSVDQNMEAIGMAREAGFENINLDLIFGIPGQTPEDWRISLHQAVAQRPEHLSIYNLTYEQGTPFHRRREEGTLQPMDEQMEAKLYEYSLNFLAQKGYRRYEISNYCKLGFACKHNLGYWNYRPYLGFGPSAHSFDGTRRCGNQPDLETYIRNLKKGMLPLHSTERITRRLHQEEWLFLQMRQIGGIKYGDLKETFALSEGEVLARIREYFGDQYPHLFQPQAEALAFTPRGMWLSDEILPILLQLLQPSGISPEGV